MNSVVLSLSSGGPADHSSREPSGPEEQLPNQSVLQSLIQGGVPSLDSQLGTNIPPEVKQPQHYDQPQTLMKTVTQPTTAATATTPTMTTLMYVKQKIPTREACEGQVRATARGFWRWIVAIGVALALVACFLTGALAWHFAKVAVDNQSTRNALVAANGAAEAVEQYFRYAEHNTNQVAEMAITLLTNSDSGEANRKPIPSAATAGTLALNETLFDFLTSRLLTTVVADNGEATVYSDFRGIKVSLLFPTLAFDGATSFSEFSSVGAHAFEASSTSRSRLPIWMINSNGTTNEQAFELSSTATTSAVSSNSREQWQLPHPLVSLGDCGYLCLHRGASPDGTWRWQCNLEAWLLGSINTKLDSSNNRAHYEEPLMTFERLFSFNDTCAFVVATSVALTDASAAVRADSRFPVDSDSFFYLLLDPRTQTTAFDRSRMTGLPKAASNLPAGSPDSQAERKMSAIASEHLKWAENAASASTPYSQSHVVGWNEINGKDYLITISTVTLPTLSGAARGAYYSAANVADIYTNICNTSTPAAAPLLLLVIAQDRSVLDEHQVPFIALSTAASPVAMILICVAVLAAGVFAARQIHATGMVIIVVGEFLARFDADAAKRHLLGARNCAIICAQDQEDKERFVTNRSVGLSSPKSDKGQSDSIIVQLRRSTGDQVLDKELMNLIQNLIAFKKYLPPSIVQQLPEQADGDLAASSDVDDMTDGVFFSSPKTNTQIAGGDAYGADADEEYLSPEQRELMSHDDAFSGEVISSSQDKTLDSMNNMPVFPTIKSMASIYGFSWNDNELLKETAEEWAPDDQASNPTSSLASNVTSPIRTDPTTNLRTYPRAKATLDKTIRTSQFRALKGTVMYVDLGGLAIGSNAPSDMTTILNTFVECVTRNVTAARGHIDFIRGTVIFATFNFHVTCPNHESAAATVAAQIAEALGQQKQLPSNNNLWLNGTDALQLGEVSLFGSPLPTSSIRPPPLSPPPAPISNDVPPLAPTPTVAPPPPTPTVPRHNFDVVVTAVTGTCLVGTFVPSSTNKLKIVTGDAVHIAKQLVSLARILQCPVLVTGPIVEKTSLLGIPVDRVSPYLRGSFAAPLTVFELRNTPKDDIGADEIRMFSGFESLTKGKFTEAIAAFQSSNDPQASRAAAAIEFHVTDAKVIPGLIVAQKQKAKYRSSNGSSGDQPMRILGVEADMPAIPPMAATITEDEIPPYMRKEQPWENYETKIATDELPSQKFQSKKDKSHDQLPSHMGTSSGGVSPVLKTRSNPSETGTKRSTSAVAVGSNATNSTYYADSSKRTVASPVFSQVAGKHLDRSDSKGHIQSLLGANMNLEIASTTLVPSKFGDTQHNSNSEAPHSDNRESYVISKESVATTAATIARTPEIHHSPAESTDSSHDDVLNLSYNHLVGAMQGLKNATNENSEIRTAKERLETLETNVRQAATDKATIVEAEDGNALFSIFVSASPDGNPETEGTSNPPSVAKGASMTNNSISNRKLSAHSGEEQAPAPAPKHLPMTEGALVALDGETYYQLDRQLGAGQFGEVFLAMTAHGRLVALKNFSLEKLGIDNKVTAAKLLAEVRTLSELKHPNIASYVSCAIDGDRFSLVMEFLSAGTIRTLISDLGRIPFAAAKQYLKDVLCGLRYLHDNRLAHCDMKPDNVLLTENGECKIADFGTALLGEAGGGGNASIMATSVRPSSVNVAEGNPVNASQKSGSGADPSNTSVSEKAMMVRGTPRYMSPEAAMGEWAPPADVYSLGLMFVEMLTGKNPWHKFGGNDTTFLMRLARDETMVPELPFGKGFEESILWPSAYQGVKDYESLNSARGGPKSSSGFSSHSNRQSSNSGNTNRSENKSIGSVDSTAAFASQWDSETFAIQFALRALDRNPVRRPTVAQLQHLFFEVDEDHFGANRSTLGRTPAGALEMSILAIHGLGSSSRPHPNQILSSMNNIQYTIPETQDTVVQLSLPPNSPFFGGGSPNRKEKSSLVAAASSNSNPASPITPLLGMSPNQPMQIPGTSAMVSPMTPLTGLVGDPRASAAAYSALIPSIRTVSGISSGSNFSTPIITGAAGGSCSNSGMMIGKGPVIPLFGPSSSSANNAILADSNLPRASPSSATLTLPPLTSVTVTPHTRTYGTPARMTVSVPSNSNAALLDVSRPLMQTHLSSAVLSPLQSTAPPQENNHPNNSNSSQITSQVASLANTVDGGSFDEGRGGHNNNNGNNSNSANNSGRLLRAGMMSGSASEDRGGGLDSQIHHPFFSPLNGTMAFGPSPNVRRASTQSYNNSQSEALSDVDAVASIQPVRLSGK